MTARGTVTGISGNENGSERRIEVAESLTVSPLAGIANESGKSQALDFPLALLGILLGMVVCSPLGTHQAENAPAIQGTKRCAF